MAISDPLIIFNRQGYMQAANMVARQYIGLRTMEASLGEESVADEAFVQPLLNAIVPPAAGPGQQHKVTILIEGERDASEEELSPAPQARRLHLADLFQHMDGSPVVISPFSMHGVPTMSDTESGSHSAHSSTTAQCRRVFLRAVDGTRRSVEATFTKAHFDHHQLLFVVFRDMTARERAAADLRGAKELETRTNDLKDRFLLYVCHELRSPIHAIAFSCDLLEGSLSGEEEGMRKNIADAVRLMETIADDILDFQLLQSGKFEQHRGAMDMMQLLTNLAWMFRGTALEPGKAIAWRVGVRADVPKVVTGDSLRTVQCLVNMVQNAFRFTTRGAVCVVVQRVSQRFAAQRLGPKADTTRLMTAYSVCDTGGGIAAEDVPRLFDAYWQPNHTDGRAYGGAGIGLWIVRCIVEKMDGVLLLDTDLGKGTTLTMLIPRDSPVASKQLQQDESPSLRSFKLPSKIFDSAELSSLASTSSSDGPPSHSTDKVSAVPEDPEATCLVLPATPVPITITLSPAHFHGASHPPVLKLALENAKEYMMKRRTAPTPARTPSANVMTPASTRSDVMGMNPRRVAIQFRNETLRRSLSGMSPRRDKSPTFPNHLDTVMEPRPRSVSPISGDGYLTITTPAVGTPAASQILLAEGSWGLIVYL